MQPGDQARSRLNDEMNQRRLQLRLKWKTVAERAGLSVAHFSRIRNGTSPLSDLAKSGIETALEWPPGTIDRITAGTEPVATPSAPTPEPREITDSAPRMYDLPRHDDGPPSPYEAAVMDILAAMREEIRTLNNKVDALSDERERDRGEVNQGTRDQKGA